MASARQDTCFIAVQKELTSKEGPNELITLRKLQPEESSDMTLNAYAWIEDLNNPHSWPYHSMWIAIVKRYNNQCKVVDLQLLYESM